MGERIGVCSRGAEGPHNKELSTIVWNNWERKIRHFGCSALLRCQHNDTAKYRVKHILSDQVTILAKTFDKLLRGTR